MLVNSSQIYVKKHKIEISLISKLYVWSIALEPLLFFIVVDSSLVGITGNISRLLQLTVILLLITKVLLGSFSSLIIPNPWFSDYKWYTFYLFYLVIAAVFGLVDGAYVLAYTNTAVQVIENGITIASGQSGIADIIKSSYVRPFLEYFITIYYFVYFAILPRYLLFNEQAINYCLKVFIRLFFISLWVGIVAYIVTNLFSYDFLPRHFSDYFKWDPVNNIASVTWVGDRFHGLAGEPRDAFVYMIFGIGLFSIRDYWFGIKTSKLWLLAFLIAAILTKSTSGYLGLLIGFGLVFLYQLPRMPVLYLIPLLSSILIIFSVITYIIFFSYTGSTEATLQVSRIENYIIQIPLAFQIFEENTVLILGLLPEAISNQVVDIYPLWLRFNEASEFNILPLIFGSGPGSAAFANSMLYPEGGLYNPRANLVRLIFESGLIGTFLFINAFIRPIRMLTLSKQSMQNFLFAMLLLMGATFGHRSSTIYIFLGLIFLVFSYKNSIKDKSIVIEQDD